MSQGSDELLKQVLDLINEGSTRTITATDIWVRLENGEIRYGHLTETGRQALLNFETYREG